MQKIIVTLVTAAALLPLVGGVALAEEPQLIGAPKCKICHGKKTGDQWTIWEESKHAQAFATLASEESQKIATERGLGDPQKAEECLKCHTTHAFVGRDVAIAKSNKYEEAEGVGCEACHGPGSEYKSKKTMEDREAAVAAGLWIPAGAEDCQKCHNEESPTYKPFDYEARWAEIAHPVPDDS
jgi:hypothetical protein